MILINKLMISYLREKRLVNSRFILFVTIILSSLSFLLSQDSDSQCENVSIINLIATPEKYNEKMVCFSGFLHLEFESYGIYLTQNDIQYRMSKNGIFIYGVDESLYKFNDKYVYIEGKFINSIESKDSRYKGHPSLFSGLIRGARIVSTSKVD